MKKNFFHEVFNKNPRRRTWWIFVVILILAITAGLIAGGNYYNKFSDNLASKTHNWVALPKVKDMPFRLGLDLQGGSQLTYEADVKNVPDADKDSAVEGVRDVIERRVNIFGVSEPVIQVNKTTSGKYRIIAELAGIKDVGEAIKMIGETPLLEFKETAPATSTAITATPVVVTPAGTKASSTKAAATASTTPVAASVDLSGAQQPNWQNTNLTGKNLKRAVVNFSSTDGSPEVSLEFDDAGAKLFEDITGRNIGKQVAIFLDGYPISAPTVQSKITGGKAVISGTFTAEEAKLLAQRLNTGALPVPISLVSQETVGASLGQQSVEHSVQAGFVGLALVALFMIIFYRFPGVLSVFALAIYGFISLAIFKLWPVTITLSGIAGFILSIGMAVDANILIFERTKEEIRNGKTLGLAISDGFNRAWPSIRDSNITTIIVCLVLVTFSTSVIKGFAFTLLLGVIISMFTAIFVTRNFLKLIGNKWLEKYKWLITTSKKKKAETTESK